MLAAMFFFPLNASAQDSAPAAGVDLAAGAKTAGEVCVACHGADGNSELSDNPRLAGQHAGYLVKQLNDFKVQEGEEEARRASAMMAGFAAMLSEEDIRNVAAHFAAQKLVPATAENRDLAEAGRDIYRAGIADKGVPACTGCHGPAGAGLPTIYPRLQGQFAEYTVRELEKFRSGERANSEEMKAIAERLLDREIEAVAQYIAGLR